MALMWTPTRAFQFFDSKPKWHKSHKSRRNQWAHQSQNENLFSQFLARKKKVQISCLHWSYADPRLHGGSVISESAQQSFCHVTSKWSWLLSHQPGQALPLSSPSFTSSPDPRCITYKRHCWIPCPSPQNEHGKAWRASKENGGRDQRTQKPVSSCKAQRPLSV